MSVAQNIEDVIQFIKQRKLLLCTAESCTAGLVASRVADVPGSGAILEISFTVYSPEAKKHNLGVSAQTIDRYGLTSEEVASEMALGALANSRATIALANTGKATSDDELDGVVCFACAMEVANKRYVVHETVHFDGSRNEVRMAAAEYVLLHLPVYYQQLMNKSPK
ncbi:CinA family protein [Halopseudomonas pelagia]|uniref:CinA family protein n=1 Tax=Halopseudomonas pelagia TaxID=553151 RepID=A0AA91U348_9GAMM|nr:CinA family protein [Halopseudomonas pelagia]PCC99845.1 ompetence-damaged protein [Halopseudomonas pelagia]QFY56294.1 CinA family protein [Halopseudomonas pelagia]